MYYIVSFPSNIDLSNKKQGIEITLYKMLILVCESK